MTAGKGIAGAGDTDPLKEADEPMDDLLLRDTGGGSIGIVRGVPGVEDADGDLAAFECELDGRGRV